MRTGLTGCGFGASPQSKRYGDITLNSTADTVSCALNVRLCLGNPLPFIA